MKSAYAFTLLAILAWTTGPVGSKAALLAEGEGPSLTPSQVAFWAIAVGWLALLLFLALRGRMPLLRGFTGRGWVVLAAMGLFGWMVYPAAINSAYRRLSLADALVISSLAPVFVVMLQGPGFGRLVRVISGWEQPPDQRPRRRPWRTGVGFLLCLLGVAATATQGHPLAVTHLRLGSGAAAALLAALAWGIYSNLGRFVPVRPGFAPRALADLQTLVSMAFGLLLLGGGLAQAGAFGWPVDHAAAFHLGSTFPLWVNAGLIVAVMGVGNYCAGYPLWLHALEVGAHAGDAARLPLLTYLQPVLSIALGWALLRQPLGPGFWEGAALIAAGNALAVWPERAR